MQKYDSAPDEYVINNDIVYAYGSTEIYRRSQINVKIDFIKIHDNRLTLEASSIFCGFNPNTKVQWYLKVNNDLIPCMNINRNGNITSLDERIAILLGFTTSFIWKRVNHITSLLSAKLVMHILSNKKLALANFHLYKERCGILTT